MQDLLWFETGKKSGAGEEEGALGRFESSGLRPYFVPRAEHYGLDKLLLETLSCQASS
jgi:hypothetical protein